jgi:hypothetical protein
MPVTINGYNYFSENGYHGLAIFSYGVVTLNNLHAADNGQNIVNTSGSGVLVENWNGTYAKAVYVKGVNVFDGNDGIGLGIFSDGAISVAKITANDNRSNGARLINGDSPVQSSVTISGYGVFEWNGWGTGYQEGLYVNSNGTITATNITSQYNAGTGAELYTRGLTSVHAVTLSGVNNFNYNGNAGIESGLIINADGTITVNKITASYNFSFGAKLDNYTNWAVNGFLYPGSVKIYGYGWFVGNLNAAGLAVRSYMGVTLNRVTAFNNGFLGIDVYNAYGGTASVTMVCVVSSANGFSNVVVETGGNLTLKGILESEGLVSYTVAGTTTITTCP